MSVVVLDGWGWYPEGGQQLEESVLREDSVRVQGGGDGSGVGDRSSR